MTQPSQAEVVVENYHGVWVADPFRWLEDPLSERTRAWTDEQNTAARAVLDAIPARAAIEARLKQLWNHTQLGAHVRRGDRLFFLRKDGLQNQPCLYVEAPSGEVRTLVDPNRLRADGTAALTAFSPNDDGTKVAYAIAQSGSDWQTIHVVDVETGATEPDEISWCKFTNAAWLPDGSGFFYTRFPEPDTSRVADQSQGARVHFHRLGAPQSDDALVYHRPDAPALGFHPEVSEDGRYLFLHVTHGTDAETRLYVRPLGSDGDFQRLLDKADAMYRLVGTVGDDLFVLTDFGAPNRRVVKFHVDRPEPEHWVEVVPECEHTLSFCAMAGGKLLVCYLQDAAHRVHLLPSDGHGTPIPIELPALGTLTTLSARSTDNRVLFGLTSFLFPNQIFELDVEAGLVRPFRTVEMDFPVDAYETVQVFYPSKDGTRVPMFLTHRKGLALDGNNPVLLTGYGGFNLPTTPQFSPSVLYWLEQGGVYASANMRGGSEYGQAWHRAGMLEQKQNVFDDFHAAAEWLVARGYTRPGRLATRGGSNGGLLVAATMLQRPELYGAVICQVPVIDMLRYHRFTVGRYWVGEYGNAEENAEHFRFLYSYSPLHNVVYGRVYPPILITTADSDDRVVPSHAKKFYATLQAASPGVNPILLRVESGAGHGLGKPTSKLIAEQADIYAFIGQVFGMLETAPGTP
ncbi:MAG: prolyl oligopeptidase family serine peptidase [Alicyclobacillus sp.]|nr:prolyl oligopeptidase family serine peptidase [Alicyclobacillus sp.]